MDKKYNQLRLILFISFGLAALIPSLTLSTYWIAKWNIAQIEEADKLLSFSAHSLARSFSQFLDSYVKSTLSLSKDVGPLVQTHPLQAAKLLEKFRSRNMIFDSFSIVGVDANYSENRPYILGGKTMRVLTPIYGTDRTRIGSLIGVLNKDTIQGIIGQLGSEYPGLSFEISEEIPQSDMRMATIPIRIYNLGWNAIAKQSNSVLELNLRKSRTQAILLTISVLLMSLIAAYFISKWLVTRFQIQANKLMRSNDDLQRFSYVTSHHLQEPLRMISSYLQLLEARYLNKLDDEAKEFIRFAVEGAQRMKQLILDLLEYTDVSTHPKEQTVTDSGTALKKALHQLEHAIAQTKAQVTYDTLPTVMANESQLECLFQNLIGNALKYHSKGVDPVIHISAKKTGAAWDFSVRDNGIGIPKEYFDKIFLLFNRLHGNHEYPGTGIGLSVCEKILENHGGRIWVESEPGKGSNFQFTLFGS